MHVINVQTSQDERRYVVIDDQEFMIEPIVRYLKYLNRTGAARNTLRSYAAALKHYWQYLAQERLDWQQITLDDLARFVLWLKLPSGSFKMLPAQPVPQARSNRTINHALTVVSTLQNLVEQDIDAFLLDLRATPNSRGKKTKGQ